MSITSAFSLPCENNTGGLSRIWITDIDNVSSFTLSGSEYNAVTMVSSAVFYLHEFEQDTGAMRNNASRENYSTVVQHEVEAYFTKFNTAQRDALQDIIDSSTCGVCVIAEDANTNKWVLGYSQNHTVNRPMKLQSIESTTGASFTDANGSTMILASSDTEMPRIFTGTVPV